MWAQFSKTKSVVTIQPSFIIRKRATGRSALIFAGHAIFLGATLGVAVAGTSVQAWAEPTGAARLSRLQIFAPTGRLDLDTESSFSADGQRVPNIRVPGLPAKGVTCDNGPAVPLNRWSYVVIPLPLDFDVDKTPEITLTRGLVPSAATTAAPVSDEADGANREELSTRLRASLDAARPLAEQLFARETSEMAAALSGSMGVATFHPKEREVRYFPPLEFNEQQERDARGRLVVSPRDTRAVDVTIRGNRVLGGAFSGQATVLLKRPTVVLVHGINNGPVDWQGQRGVGVGRALDALRFDTISVNYGDDDRKMAGVQRSGARYFRGNAPIEYAAECLEATVERAVAARRGAGFVTNRVDMLGHSYGGQVSRWYVMTHSPRAAGSAPLPDTYRWYVNSANNTAPANIYRIDPALYAAASAGFNASSEGGRAPYHHVRKLITIASPWRGTPVANIVNEVHGPVPEGRIGLGSQRLRWNGLRLVRLGRFISRIVKTVAVPDDVPSIEVVAVESRWLQTLNARPFRDDIAYGAIAGNDNAYIGSRVDIYSALHKTLPGELSQKLALERIPNRHGNLSDGLIPVWSAVIWQNSRVVPAAHDAILWNGAAKVYLAAALSDATLEDGSKLNEMWRTNWKFDLRLPKEKNFPEATTTYSFVPGQMAPEDRGDAYQLRYLDGGSQGEPNADAVARINPELLPLR